MRPVRMSNVSSRFTAGLTCGILFPERDSGDTAATARLRVVPLALFALMVPSYLLRGYFAPAFGNPVTGVAVEETDRMLSELAVRGHVEVSLERGRLVYALWERRASP